MDPSLPLAGYEPDVQTSAFFGDLDEPDPGLKEMLGLNTILPGPDDELNILGCLGRRNATADPVRLVISGGTARQVLTEEGTSDMSKIVLRPHRKQQDCHTRATDADDRILGASWRKGASGENATSELRTTSPGQEAVVRCATKIMGWSTRRVR